MENKVKVKNMTSAKGNKIANQFIIQIGYSFYFQSYNSIIVKMTWEQDKMVIYLDEYYWDYSVTTGKYRNQFLKETKKETKQKIKQGIYQLTNLNK